MKWNEMEKRKMRQFKYWIGTREMDGIPVPKKCTKIPFLMSRAV